MILFEAIICPRAIYILYYFFLSLTFQPTYCWYRILLLHLMKLNDAYMLGRTPLDEGSARLPYKTQRLQQTDIMPPAIFEPAISAHKTPQTKALDRSANGTGLLRTLTH